METTMTNNSFTDSRTAVDKVPVPSLANETAALCGLTEAALDRYNVPSEMRDRLMKLDSYDFSFLTNAFNDDLIKRGRVFSVEQVYPIIARFGKADREIALRLEREFRRFVVLTLLAPDVPHAPSGAVDMYWHFFILHTEAYESFCKDVWGSYQPDDEYRHHYPANDSTRGGMLNAYIHTRRLYVDVFGEPEPVRVVNASMHDGYVDVPVWTPEATTCGDSYSGYIPGDLGSN
jgi:hypothetical protein